ncbi:molybdopterin-dependent oxidoreductase [Luminiphilus sp.]|nr:molybdopterin-dependent oxidoreductase [Luminiphilus sp.]MDC6485654.1 molybdopterin-dependent oxidoreductase [Luminiphilus sp.]
MKQERQTHYRACHLCEAICGVVIETEGSEVVSIKGDADDPLSRGHICPKAVALQDIHSDPDRLRQPVKRVRNDDGVYEHQPIEWNEALDLAAQGLIKTIKNHGVDAVGIYMGNPTVHNYGMMTHQSALFKHIRTRNRYSATSVDQLPHHLISFWLFGHKLMFPIPDIDRTDYFLMIGANPVASNGSIWTVPDVRKRIKSLTERGGKLVVIDPRRTETAELATAHHAIRPGADAALLLAMVHVLFRDDLVRTGHLTDFVDGIDEIRQAVESYTPNWAASHTGMNETVITELAHDFAGAGSAICYGRMGVSTQRFGTLCQWAIQVINVLTGNLDREGGSLFTLPAVDQVLGTSPGGFGRHTSRVRQLPEFDRELPVACLAEEITTPGDGKIRALFTGAGNPVLSTPAGDALDDALEELEFMVSLDPWINETTRHADVILPPTSPLEHDHYDLAFHVNAMRNTARFSEAVFEKPDGAMHDWEIFQGLGERVAQALDLEVRKAVPPHVIIDHGLKAGPYGDNSDYKLSIEALRATPSGVDLGPLKPQLPKRLKTPGQRINLAPPAIFGDLARLEQQLGEASEGYRLIGRRHVRDCNSWMHNFTRLVKGPQRCTLQVSSVDAQREGWLAGSQVSVSSQAGEIVVELEITDTMMPGVVSLPHGYGHDRQGTRSEVANAHAGVSCNTITESTYIDELTGNAALNGVGVSIASL